MNPYFKAEDFVGRITRCLAAICLMIVFVLFLINIIRRVPFITWNPTWIDETIMFFLVWMIFLAAAELVRTGEHFIVDLVTDKLKGRISGRICRLIATVIMLLTYFVILYFGVKLCIRSNIKATSSLPTFIKMSWFYTCIPVCTFFMVIYALRDVYYAVMDLATGGKVTAKLEEMKAAAMAKDEDALAIERARKALEEHKNKGGCGG